MNRTANKTCQIACCITSHGYGHAARCASIMESLAQIIDVQFHIFTTVPSWFFKESLSVPFKYYLYEMDIGLVQSSSLKENFTATLERLAAFYPVRRENVKQVASCLRKCQVVLCDVTPMGILAAKEAGIPSILIENFTWDWIYKGYEQKDKGFAYFAEYLEKIYSHADFHIQTEPVCHRTPCSLTTFPVSRKTKKKPEQIHSQLQVDGRRMLLLTMGGIGWETIDQKALLQMAENVFILPGFSEKITFKKNLRFLPHNSEFYHPDLVAASDAVIGKVGYSTLAEVYHAEVPWGYITRPDFPESKPLAKFIQSQMKGIEIAIDDFTSGRWTGTLTPLQGLKNKHEKKQNGADQAAVFIKSILLLLKNLPK